MCKVIQNETADELVINGWKEGVTLEQMRARLWDAGFMVNSFAILKTWVELEDNKKFIGE